MLASGHGLSSTSSPGHWLSSSLETGRPESRSKQARKRLWIDTICELLCCSTQGEHRVQPDHSLRTTERRRERKIQVHRVYREPRFITLLSYLHILSCRTANSHRDKDWRTEKSTKRTIITTCHSPGSIKDKLHTQAGNHKERAESDDNTVRKHSCLYQQQGLIETTDQVLQPMVTVAPCGTVTGVGGSPGAWCCKWMQPHSSGGTQLPLYCSRPWKEKHTSQIKKKQRSDRICVLVIKYSTFVLCCAQITCIEMHQCRIHTSGKRAV